MLLSLLTAHLLMAICAPGLVHLMGRRAFLVLALAPASVAAYALTLTDEITNGGVHREGFNWIPALNISVTFRIDSLTWLMLLVAGTVGAVVLVYCAAYFSATASSMGRFGGVLVAFAGTMAGLVAADNTLVMFIFWELTTVFSYLLIGHYSDRKSSRRAAMQAIIVTTAGGLAMLVGLIIMGEVDGGSYSLETLIANPPTGTAVTAAVVCILAGAITKSAQFPFHFWLPSAMAAPTPVSAYLHAAAMVKAGVYIVARFAPGFSHLTAWLWIIIVLSLATLLLGGYRALRQYDLKLILAYGTVSQLGLIILFLGLGSKAAALAGLAMLGAHAMFKASLFLTVGSLDVVTGTRDIRRLTGVGRRLPGLAIAGGLAVASMIGLPPFAGYVAKEAGLEALVHGGGADSAPWVGIVVTAGVVLGSVLTFAYGLRWWWGAFCSKSAVAHPPQVVAIEPAGDVVCEPINLDPIDPTALRRPALLLVLPPLALAVAGLLAGVFPHLGERLLSGYADTYPTGKPGHLTLWGGFGWPIALTGIVVVVGIALFAMRNSVAAFQRKLAVSFEAEHIYRRFMRRLDDLAADVTAVTQRGSLPAYLSIILGVLVLGPGLTLLFTSDWAVPVRAWDTPVQAIPVIVICISVVLVARSRRRLKAAILMGFAGYSTAALFMLHGAPDLALTQVLVETITLVIMVLVLRRLPPYFSDRPLARSRWVRLALATSVGVVVMGMAIIAPSVRIHAPVTQGIAQEIYESGGGKNIVNVMLVDTRAWDTMGEISVLLVAATGVASLVFLRRRSSEILRASDVTEQTNVWAGAADPDAALRVSGAPERDVFGRPSSLTWLRAGESLAPQRRSLIFEVVTRLIFQAIVVFALFLLFSGHNQAGGGFAAGLVVGVALIIRYLAGGRYELGEALPVQPGVLLGSGLFLAVGSGLVGLLATGNALSSAIIKFTLPLLGDVKLVTTLFFDIGVFLVVVGLVLDILRSLGAEIDKQGEVG